MSEAMAICMRTVFSVRRTLGLPIALVATIVVAEGAVLLFRPRDLGPAPVPVDARAYFSPGQLEKAVDFRSGQLWLYGARLLIELGVLVVLVRRAPERVRAAGERRPVLAGAATAAVISLVLGLVPLPVAAVARERAKDVGLVTQDWVGWVGDIAKSQAISVVLWGGGGALLVVGMRRLGRRWWVAGAAVVVLFGVAITYASPIVLDPLFNKFTPLKQGQTRSGVLELAERAGVDVGQVYEIDASRRTTAANAYVTGIGHTKRVVLYDNLLKDFTPAEVRLVVAHELGHVRHDDVPHGLLYLAIIAPFGMFAIARLGERLAPRDTLGTPAALPGVILAVALVAPAITVISNQLSRAVERRADAFALELTHEPKTQIAFQRRIAIKNVSDPDPPGWVTFLLGTHPPTIERIGQAEAAARASPREG
jgi:Zn-dependent protease with chaperone function